jgi:trigger factor
MQSRLIDRLVEDSSFDVPGVLVDERLEARLKEAMQTLMMQGVHPSTLKLDWNQFREQQREKAVLDVKRAILLEDIAEKEQLTVSDEELEEEIARIAQGADQPIEAVRSRLTRDGGAARMKSTIRNRKCLDLILRLASVKTPPGLIVQP